MHFDGITGCFSIPYSTTFPTAVFSATAWVNVPSLPQTGIIIGRGEDDTSDNAVWALLVYGNKFAVQLENAFNNNFVYEPPTQITPGVWHHVGATRAPDGTLVLYVDGEEIGRHAQTLVPSSNNVQTLTIGCYLANNGPPPPTGHLPSAWLKATIEDVAMWTRDLSPPEIRDLYLRPPSPSSIGLVGFWRFDEGSGQMSEDASPSMNHGILGFSTSAAADDPTWEDYGIASVTLHVEPTRLSWYPSPRADDQYDVVRGDLQTLHDTRGDFSAATVLCLSNDQPETTLSDPDVPELGAGFWYLVRTIRPGGNGTYDSCEPSQVGLRDAEIASSGVDCSP